MSKDLHLRLNAALNFHGICASNFDISRVPSSHETAAHNASCEFVRNYINGELTVDQEETEDGDLDAGYAAGVMLSDDLCDRGIYTDAESVVQIGVAAPPKNAAIRYVVDIYPREDDTGGK